MEQASIQSGRGASRCTVRVPFLCIVSSIFLPHLHHHRSPSSPLIRIIRPAAPSFALRKRKHSIDDTTPLVGPIVEAFGTDRILYGSSDTANPGDWYELAREVVAELCLEQEAVDAIFSGNANGVYGQ
jgi:hypothetical protein